MTRLDDADRDAGRTSSSSPPTRPATPSRCSGATSTASTPTFVGLTGAARRRSSTRRQDRWASPIAKGKKLPSGGYDVTHSTTIIAIDVHDGAPVNWPAETSPAAARRDINTLLAEGRPLMTLLRLHPEPLPGRLGPRAVASAATPCASSPASSPHLDRRAALGRPGRTAGDVTDLALGVPFGLVGGRLYHVSPTRPLLLRGKHPVTRSTSGAAASASGARSRSARSASPSGPAAGDPDAPVLDAIAPAVLVAQAMGRWALVQPGLFGRPTDLPWALEIDPCTGRPASPHEATFHPTFLYESL